MATTNMLNSETKEIDHLFASEQHRLRTFESWSDFPSSTVRQLALAGFLLQNSVSSCPQCGITIERSEIDHDEEYPENHFRSVHREKVSSLGKRCGFLLCESGSNIDNLRDANISKEKVLLEAEIPEFKDYQSRLTSFQDWPLREKIENSSKTPPITPRLLATQGFFYSGPEDGVTCFYCGNTLLSWSQHIESNNQHIVQLEHARFFPCRFINFSAGPKFVANATFLHPVSDQERRERNPMSWKLVKVDPEENLTVPKNVDECLLTFDEWPSSAPITAKELAAVGFYSLRDNLKVKCFACGLEVNDWTFGMTASGTHRRRKPNCPIVHTILNSSTINFQAMNEKWRLETLTALSFPSSDPEKPNSDLTDQKISAELAACGFFRIKNRKIIRCAFCAVTIEPQADQSIMSQHRKLVKRSLLKKNFTDGRKTTMHIDCPMVRANCPANISIIGRKSFPEYPEYQNVFERIKTFEHHKDKKKLKDKYINEMANAGFFYGHSRGLRCFQCGNFCPINPKKNKEKIGTNELIKIHAHLYPTCEWVQEILGPKYVAQVLHDLYQSNLFDHDQSFSLNSQSSSSLSIMESSSTSTNSPTFRPQNIDDEYDSDRHHDSSSDEEFRSVATPVTASIMKSNPIRSISVPNHLDPSTTLEIAETCRDPILIPASMPTSSVSPFAPDQIDRYQKKNLVTNNGDDSNEFQAPETPSSIPSPSGCLRPVDLIELNSHESNRLATFDQLHSRLFANTNVEHLAYVGFYLSSTLNRVQCPWCEVQLTDEEFTEIVSSRPSVPIQKLLEEEWTPMRVHRHANGLIIDDKHPWCPWVRRQAGGLHPNVILSKSFMKYPEYPNYSDYAKRYASFTDEWSYPAATLLAPNNMARAGFFHIGDDSVCCFYCGNKLQKFEPRDCPVEEHATFYPHCDYIQMICGSDYIERVIAENGEVPQGRFKYEQDSGQIIKRIVFGKSGTNIRKTERRPADRKISLLTPISPSPSANQILISTEQHNNLIDSTCIVCFEEPVAFEYESCHHRSVCADCSTKLEQKHREECMICRCPSKLIKIIRETVQ